MSLFGRKISLYIFFFVLIGISVVFWYFSGKKTEVEQGGYLDLGPMMIELYSVDGAKEYLKMDLTLLITPTKTLELTKKYIQDSLPLIKDVFVIFFSSLSSVDLKDKGNFFYFKAELLSRINKVITPHTVDEVLFKEFITGY